MSVFLPCLSVCSLRSETVSHPSCCGTQSVVGAEHRWLYSKKKKKSTGKKSPLGWVERFLPKTFNTYVCAVISVWQCFLSAWSVKCFARDIEENSIWSFSFHWRLLLPGAYKAYWGMLCGQILRCSLNKLVLTIWLVSNLLKNKSDWFKGDSSAITLGCQIEKRGVKSLPSLSPTTPGSQVGKPPPCEPFQDYSAHCTWI